MFQPQPTPYLPFSPYGVASPISDFSGFQPTAGLVVGSGSGGGGAGAGGNSGPAVFRDPIFSPVAVATNNNFTNNNTSHNYKMAGSDLDAQEALARDFRPALEVR